MNAHLSIQNLVRTRGFRQLASQSKGRDQFNLIEMLETTVSENAFSRVVAFLFDSRREHSPGNRAFLHWIVLAGVSTTIRTIAKRHSIQSFAETQWTTPDGRFLDILVRLVDAKGKVRAVVGIENKVRAGEEENQVGDYQKALVRNFPGIPKAMVFLTPDGRLPSTADPTQNQCPASVARYDTLVELSEKLSQDATVQLDLRRLLDSLQNYIRNTIIMPIKERHAVTKLVRELYQKPSNREAMRLIAECLPCVKHVAESIEPAIHRRIAAKFPKADGYWLYDPVRSDNPYQLKWIPRELEARTYASRTQIALNFLLRCESFKPTIGDEYQFIVAAWCGKTADHAKAAKLALSDWAGSLSRTLSSCWEPVWIGGCYRLQDLADKDTAGLQKLFMSGLHLTYPQLQKRVSANFPLKK